jgi:hypothetical protein
MGWVLWKIQRASKECFGIRTSEIFAAISELFWQKIGHVKGVSPILFELELRSHTRSAIRFSPRLAPTRSYFGDPIALIITK